MKKVLCMLLTALLAGCASDAPVTPEPETCPVETFADAGLLIDPQSRSLDSSDAAKVAALFQKRSNGTSSRSAIEPSSSVVTTIKDEASGKPLLYIVNHGNDGGFAIVSASKMTEPLLAYSERGSFEVSTSSASSLLLEGMKEEVRNATANSSDSLKRMHALSWAMFEQPVGETFIAQSRAGSTDINQMIATKIAKMESKGYKYAGKLGWAQSHLTANEYEALCRDISSHCDPQYDYKETSLCFTKEGYDVSIGPMLKTKWHQYYPYNYAAKYKSPGLKNPVAGCGPIAIAQICNFYKYPSKYKWDQIEAYSSGIKMNFRDLLCDIGDYSQARYEEGVTTTSTINEAMAYQKFGYSGATVKDISVTDMISAIKNGKPIHMRGDSISKNVGHAWVCDGYQKQVKKAIVSFIGHPGILLDQDPGDPYYDYAIKYVGENPSDDAYASYTDCFHMNLGWGGESDGWYTYSRYGGSTAGYSRNQRMIIPNRP